jgi:large subunit ribosomal protein L21e
VIKEVRQRTLKVSVMFGDKEKFLQTRLNHVRPVTAPEAKA